MTKRELLKDLGIADRLLKFWVGWYKLAINRRGRGSTYPPQTVDSLRLIKRLSDSRYFTMRFIRDLLKTRGGEETGLNAHMAFCRDILSGSNHETPSIRVDVARRVSAGVRGKNMGEDLL